MNSLIATEFPLDETQSLRYDLMNALSDSYLSYKLPGDNLTLGQLCLQIGEIEHMYTESFTTKRIDWTYRHPNPSQLQTITDLTAWYHALDSAFEAVMRDFSDDDLQTIQIDRGEGVSVSMMTQFEIYREAIMMFYAKASIYVKALSLTVSDQWDTWIG